MKHWVLVKDNEIIQHYHAESKPTIAATKGEVLELTEAYTGEVATAGEVNPAIHKVETTAGKYYGKWRILHTVTMKTADELLLDTWKHPDWVKRIIAPASLVMEDIGIKMLGWWQVMGYPFQREGANIYLYCNVILPEHQSIVDGLAGLITIEDKP